MALGQGAALTGAMTLVVPSSRAFAALPSPAPRKPQPPRLLMIDPGHGGKDPGAIGRHGTHEKDIALDISRELARQLSATPSVTPQLTRNEDIFLPLAERVKRTREARADILVSIHADSAPTAEARGLSVYTLSNKASDSFAKALARQENLADAIGGIPLPTDDEEVADILMDLTARHTTNAARLAKQSLVQGIGAQWPILEHPMRSANFAVLRAPDVPSLLIEVGFLSNPRDEKLLVNPKRRKRIAAILAKELTDLLARPPFAA